MNIVLIKFSGQHIVSIVAHYFVSVHCKTYKIMDLSTFPNRFIHQAHRSSVCLIYNQEGPTAGTLFSLKYRLEQSKGLTWSYNYKIFQNSMESWSARFSLNKILTKIWLFRALYNIKLPLPIVVEKSWFRRYLGRTKS